MSTVSTDVVVEMACDEDVPVEKRIALLEEQIETRKNAIAVFSHLMCKLRGETPEKHKVRVVLPPHVGCGVWVDGACFGGLADVKLSNNKTLNELVSAMNALAEVLDSGAIQESSDDSARIPASAFKKMKKYAQYYRHQDIQSGRIHCQNHAHDM